MEKKCPKCRLINPDYAQRCDCGYDFASQRVERSYANPNDRTSAAELGLTLAQVGRRNMRIGPYVCLAGIAVTLLTWAVSGVTGLYVIAWGAIIFGAGQYFRGLGQYRRSRRLDQKPTNPPTNV